MTDTNSLVMEEMRAIKAMHTDSMSKLGQLCGDVRELVAELRHTQKGFDSMSSRIDTLEKNVHQMQIDSATNKPILDIARSMNRNMWLMIFSALLALVGTNFDKLTG